MSEFGVMMAFRKGPWHSAAIVMLAICIFVPPLYLLVMIQYGAITLPYWDHMATAKQIVQYFDETLTFDTMIEAQSQARPLFPRLIFVANAALTNWDIRSEYIYIYITVYGALAALLFALWRISTAWPKLPALTAALLISIIACSPVGAMNHYWSLMLIATLSYLCAIVAFLVVATRPLSWPCNLLAAGLAWIGAYSISEGLFLFPAIFIVHQMIAPRKLVLTRWSWFWLVNLVACYAVYFPGLTVGNPMPPRPNLLDFIGFVIVYIGNPLGELLWFPDMGSILVKSAIVINFICGVMLLGLSGFTAWRALRELPAKRAETLIFLLFALYAGASAIVTAWGRANGPVPLAVANSSRYSIFAACLLFALIFYYTPKFARRDLAFTIWHKAATIIFLVASTVSYVRAIPVYKAAHDINDWLPDVYGPHARPTQLDGRAYPDKTYFDLKRADLLRLRIGPYRSSAEITTEISAGPFVAAVPLTPGTIVTQRFGSAYPDIRRISFEIVTWGKVPSAYAVHWDVVGLKDGGRSTIATGSLSASDFLDWKTATIKLNNLSEEQEYEVTFSVAKDVRVQNPIGLVLFPPGIDPLSPAVIDGNVREDGSKIGLRVVYQQ